MRGLEKVESGKDRKSIARDAGMGSISFLSILAGTLVAFASFAVLLAIVGGILAAVGIDTATLTANDYERLGIGSAIVAALVLFLSYFFGGYIAGRLARRSGALNGGLVLVLAIVIGGVVAAIVGTQADTQAAADNLRVIGVPTSGEDYSGFATVAGIVTLVAMIAGAILGGLKGERWHGKLAARASTPPSARRPRPATKPPRPSTVEKKSLAGPSPCNPLRSRFTMRQPPSRTPPSPCRRNRSRSRSRPVGGGRTRAGPGALHWATPHRRRPTPGARLTPREHQAPGRCSPRSGPAVPGVSGRCAAVVGPERRGRQRGRHLAGRTGATWPAAVLQRSRLPGPR